MKKMKLPANYDAKMFRWAAEYEERELDVHLDPGMVSRVIRLWLRIIVPEARVLGPEEAPIRHICFARRRDLRRFISNWGGRTILPATSRAE